MKFSLITVLIAALTVGIGGFVWSAHLAPLEHSTDQKAVEPELRWLRQEYGLSESTMERIAAKHRPYTAHCARIASALNESDAEMRRLVMGQTDITPELRKAMAQSVRINEKCKQEMLEYLFSVAKEMPPDRAQRYLNRMAPLALRAGERLQ